MMFSQGYYAEVHVMQQLQKQLPSFHSPDPDRDSNAILLGLGNFLIYAVRQLMF